MSRYVLVLNSGSSSLKYSLVDTDHGSAVGSGLVERIGEPRGRLHHQGPSGSLDEEKEVRTHEDALRLALHAFASEGPSLDDIELGAVGHRVVHGGDRFSEPALVDDDLLRTVEELVPLAPLHNPANLEGMTVALRLFPDVPHVAVFDTAFHHTLPPSAYTYALPRELLEEHHIRRYGFHGTSVAFVTRGAAELLGKPVEECRLVVLHLGNGASATAVDGGRSVDTSMGFTPLEGLVMGTRSGDVDPALPAHLNRNLGWSIDDVDRMLNRASGLKGLVGHNDFREVVRLREEGDPDAELAFDVYCHRLRKYVGAYYAVLGELDAVVFTGGIGERAPSVRESALSGLSSLGIAVDPERNGSPGEGPADVGADGSRVRVLVVPTNEEWEIARQSLEVADSAG
ncbi:MAG TPA: acetate kinase [Marmoricola sp.]|nr:acetate kinase [Marmoricola sp.]